MDEPQTSLFSPTFGRVPDRKGLKRAPLKRSKGLKRKTPLGVMPGAPRPCLYCGKMFSGKHESYSYGQKYCSNECRMSARVEPQRARWPSKDTMIRHVLKERLSDAKIGELYGHSYEWARRVRNHYGIRAVPKPPHREIKHGRYIGHGAFYQKAQKEMRCRNCGKVPRGTGPLGSIHAHHAIPRSKLKLDDPRNCLPLCFECHQGWHERTVTIYRYAFTHEEWAFLRDVKLIGERTDWWLDVHYPREKAPPPLGYWEDEDEYERWVAGD